MAAMLLHLKQVECMFQINLNVVMLLGTLECDLMRAGTPFWKLVLKQFDDLLVKVGAICSGMLMHLPDDCSL